MNFSVPMSNAIRVSVDGDSGAVVARNPGIRVVNPNLAVVRVSLFQQLPRRKSCNTCPS